VSHFGPTANLLPIFCILLLGDSRFFFVRGKICIELIDSSADPFSFIYQAFTCFYHSLEIIHPALVYPFDCWFLLATYLVDSLILTTLSIVEVNSNFFELLIFEGSFQYSDFKDSN